jgi:hypothetical protein
MGATESAVYTELASNGEADKILTAKTVAEAQHSFWRFVHAKHTPFAMEPVDFDATASQCKFGGKAKYTFPRQGDLCWQVYARYSLPGLVAVGKDGKVLRGEAAPCWHDAIGFKLTQRATLAVATTVIDTLTDTFLYVWEELSAKPGKKLGEMIGKFDTLEERQAFAKRSHQLYVPLPFSFSRNSGLALPIAALAFQPIVMELTFAPKSEVICNNDTRAQICVRPDGVTDDDIDSGKVSVSAMQDSDLECTMEANYIYLEDDEREKFQKGIFEQIVDEFQFQSQQAIANAATGSTEQSAGVRSNVRLQLNNVVMEYMMVVSPQAKKDKNESFDFSGPVDPASGLTLDPVRNITIKFNNSQRVQTRPGSYFRLVQPYQHHTNVPGDCAKKKQNFIYVWSYATDPEDIEPNGGANHSRIDNCNVEFMLDPRIFTNEAPTAEVMILARNKNVLRYKFGMCHKKFA